MKLEVIKREVAFAVEVVERNGGVGMVLTIPTSGLRAVEGGYVVEADVSYASATKLGGLLKAPGRQHRIASLEALEASGEITASQAASLERFRDVARMNAERLDKARKAKAAKAKANGGKLSPAGAR